MRSMRTTEGTKVFTKDEWLTSTQVSGYFRSMAALNGSEGLHRREEAKPAPTEPVLYPREKKAKMRRKTRTWLQLPLLEHGFKSGRS